MPSSPRATTRRHDWIDERSLAFGHAIGERVRANPQLVAVAARRLDEWEAGAAARGDARVLPALREWREILRTYSLDALVTLLGADASEHATRLRQSTPFVGILTAQERERILSHFESL